MAPFSDSDILWVAAQLRPDNMPHNDTLIVFKRIVEELRRLQKLETDLKAKDRELKDREPTK